MTDERAAPSTPPEQAPSPPDANTTPATVDSARARPEGRHAAVDAPAAAPAAAPVWRPSYFFLVAVTVVSLAADLGSKWWAKARLERGHSIEVIPNYLWFRSARNPGGAMGLLQSQPESIRRPFFLGISVLAIIFIVSLYRKLTPKQTALKWGLPLVLGGAIGNLVNRLQFNYVVDFIDFRADFVRWFMGSDHWPTFNVADVWIVVGVGLMAIDMFTPRKPAVQPRPAVEPAHAPDPKPPVDGAGDAAIDIAPDPTAPKET